MSRLDNWIDNKIVQNFFIWAFLIVIFMMLIQAENRLLISICFVAFIIPPIYISNLKILPLFYKNKIKLGIFFYLLNIIFFTFLAVFILSDFFKTFEFRMLLNAFGGLLLVMLFGTAFKLANDSFLRRQQEKVAELKLLKAQLNPHFLFNTLNNLYGLSVLKSDKLPSLMLKLSDLLRYSLYETKEVFVSLEKEIKYLQNYISLEKIRLEDKTAIKIEVLGNVPSKKIAPMLLIVFVENAFKHLGVLTNGKSSVSVKIIEKEDEIHFFCENTIDKNDFQNHTIEKGKSGIGLQNAQKRLALLYPEAYELKIEELDELYRVNLTLLK